MNGWLQRISAAIVLVGCFSGAASAGPIPIGVFSFDTDGAVSTFNITNLTGASALLPDFPIETQLTISVTSLIASTTSGNLTLGGNAFTADAAGNVNCTAPGSASTGGCNFAAFVLTGATLTGTLSPTTGLLGLPPGYSAIASAFTATLTPTCDTVLSAGCDATIISATPVPEPSTMLLFQLGLGALAGSRAYRAGPLLRRLRERRPSSPIAGGHGNSSR